MATDPDRKPFGPSNVVFRPKEHPPISLTMTKLGKSLLRATAKRTGKSHSDIVEKLLRDHSSTLTF